MEHQFTSNDLDTLADDIASDGVDAHIEQLERIADYAARSHLFPASVSVLKDQHAAPTQKARAFLSLRREWPQIMAGVAEWHQFSVSFGGLADQWQAHQQLRASGDVSALWASRNRLDSLRSGLTRPTVATC